jgi:hypothetical protein
MSSDKFVSVQIPYKSSLASIVLGYSATFNSSSEFQCSSVKAVEDDDEIEFELNYGSNKINFNDNEIIIDYQKEGTPVGLYFSADIYKILKIKIKYVNDNEISKKQNIIKDFMKEARKYYNRKESDEIICKILRNGIWRQLAKLPKRKMDTIYLPKKEKIYNDLKKFFGLEEEYKKLGIPWKRNYLLEGPPGTGKSSLIFALASSFDLDIHIINLGPKVDDSVFMSAIAALPSKTILLLEDIDSLFVERKANDSNKSLVSFSGILNVLDGMARKNGLIIFLTTNFKENLDKALIRPSRVDFQMNFKNCEKEQIKQMYLKFFPEKETKFEKFYNKIDTLELRTCILQQFFMECKFNNEKLFNVKRIRQIIGEMDNFKKVENNLYT